MSDTNTNETIDRKYVSLRRLSEYDTLIKGKIEEGDSTITSDIKSYLNTQLNGYADKTHNHDDAYYTETEIDAKFTSYYTNTQVDNKLAGKVDNATLNNYYIKDEIDNTLSTNHYTKTEVNAELSGKSDNHDHPYLPLSGGDMSGHIYLTGAKESSSTGSTSQIIFGSSTNEHVAISSNTNMIVINPDSKSTNNQILLKLDGLSSFPQGIQGNVTGNLTGNASAATKATQDASGNVIASTYETKTNASSKLTEAKSYTDTAKNDLLGGATTNYNTLKKLGVLIDGKQATITGAATTITSSDLTADRVLVSNGSGKVAVSNVTSTELGYLDNVTSNIQTQLNGKAASSHNHSASNITSGTLSSDRLPTVPIIKGGTGATDATTARTNLNVYSKAETDTAISNAVMSAIGNAIAASY